MQRVLWILAAVSLIPAIHAQCPVPNFLQAGTVTVFDDTAASALERQGDGSFTRQRFSRFSPYGKIDSTADFQPAFTNCGGAGIRAFQNLPGWTFLGPRHGAATQTLLFSNFLGNGTPVGLAVVPGGFGGGPAVDSLLVVVFTPDGNAAASQTYYPVPANPAGVLVGDFNHDGKQDVVVVSYGSGTGSPNTVSVFLGNGDGTLQPPVEYAAHTGPSSAVAYDFNGDGNLDLAVANSGSGDVSILLGHGDGTFAAPVNYPAIAQTSYLALGDFNGDGHADLMVAGGKNIGFLAGNGDGTFRAVSMIAQTFDSIGGVAAGDFNNDGKIDLALTDANDGTVSILLGDGTGKFASEYSYVVGYDPTSLFAMDVDGDGNLDVVIGTGHPDILAPDQYNDTIEVLFGRGDGTLVGPPTYRTGSQINGLALADFNGDGKPDVAAAAGDLWILLSNGGGNFKTPVRIPLSPGGTTVAADAVAAADLNGDGKQDLVVGDANGSGVYVLLGNGDGTFQAPVPYPVGGSVNSVAVADFNGDGKPDIVACGVGLSPPNGATLGILLGNGDGTFKSVTNLTGFGSGPRSVVVGDFNKDGKPDLAVVDEGTPGETTDLGGVLVYLGQGNGTFQPPVSYPAGLNPSFITAADINGDKALDLLVTTEDPNFETNFEYRVALFLGNGNGTFKAASLLPTEFGPQWIAVADLNGDGKPDLAIAHCCGDTDTTFMLGNGDGTFQPETELTASVSPSTLLAADLNGDGQPDLVIGLGTYYVGYVSVFLNLTSALTNLNGASFAAVPLAPDSFASAFGAALATVTESLPAPYPTSFGGTKVTFTDSKGVARSAPLSYVSPTQVNYIVPDGTALGQATVTVASGGTSFSEPVAIATIDPGVFLFGGTNLVAANVLVVNADNSQTVGNVYSIDSSGGLIPAPIDLSGPNTQVFLILYGTGLRGHSSAPNSVTVTAGGVNLTVSYASAQSRYAGLDQIDALLPPSLAGKGDVVIQVIVDGQAANPGHVTIK